MLKVSLEQGKVINRYNDFTKGKKAKFRINHKNILNLLIQVRIVKRQLACFYIIYSKNPFLNKHKYICKVMPVFMFLPSLEISIETIQ